MLGLFLNPWVLGAIGAVVVFSWTFRQGQLHERRKVAAEVEAVNTKLREFTLRDEATAAKDEAARSRAVVDAINTLAATGQCKLTRAQAEALGRIN